MSELLNFIKQQTTPQQPVRNYTDIQQNSLSQFIKTQTAGNKIPAVTQDTYQAQKYPFFTDNKSLYTSSVKSNLTYSEEKEKIKNTYTDYVKKQNESIKNQFNVEPINDMAKGLSNIYDIKSNSSKDFFFEPSKKGESMIMMSGFRDNDEKVSFFRVPTPHDKDGKPIGYHLNTVNQKQRKTLNLTPLQEKTLAKLDHKEIPEPIYHAFKNFDDVAETVKVAGKAAAAVGAVYDTYEFGKTIYDDLNDVDGKLGRDTDEMVFGISGGWAGGAVGTKYGTIGGSAIGTAICPGLGTVIGGFIGGSFGGIIGATAGRELGEFFVEQIYEEK